MIHISQRHLKMSKISFSKQSFSGILCKRMMVCDRVCKCLVTLYMSLCDHGQDQQANALLQMCQGVKGKTVGISVQMTLSKRSQLLSTSPNVRPHALQSVLEDNNGLEVQHYMTSNFLICWHFKTGLQDFRKSCLSATRPCMSSYNEFKLKLFSLLNEI